MESLILDALPMPGQLRGIFATLSFLDIADIILVAIIIYKLYQMLEDTRAITLVKGIIILMTLTLLSRLLNLHVINWLLEKTLAILFVALPIVFQPELRRTLEHLGQGWLFGRSAFLSDEDASYIINELDNAAQRLARQQIGALIVIERNMGLNDIADRGIQIDGLVSADFLMNVFIPNTPLHDGAAIIRGKRLIAAGCVLPLTENYSLSSELGTRHRAALGLSEQCDALILVVSEETGIISIAEEGHIHRRLTSEELREYLRPIFAPKKVSSMDMIRGWLKKKR